MSNLDFENMSPETQEKILEEIRAEKIGLQKLIAELENKHLKEQIESYAVEIKSLSSQNTKLLKELSEYSEEYIRSKINKILNEEKKVETEQSNFSPPSKPIFFSNFEDTDTEEDFKELSQESNSVSKAVESLIRSGGSRG